MIKKEAEERDDARSILMVAHTVNRQGIKQAGEYLWMRRQKPRMK